jgi:sugar/nucleoside kinase (ribokinase family)
MLVRSVEGDPIAAIGANYIDTTISVPDASFEPGEYLADTVVSRVGGSAPLFAKSIHSLEGCETIYFGRVGSDVDGKRVRRELQDNGIGHIITYDSDASTNAATHIIAPGDDNERRIGYGTANARMTIDDASKVFEMIKWNRATNEQHDVNVTAVYLGGLMKLRSLHPDLKEFVEEVRNRGMDLIVDHGRVNRKQTPLPALQAAREAVKAATVYLPSHDEFLAVWDATEPLEAIKKVRRVSPHSTVVLKMGRYGCIGFMPDSDWPIYASSYSSEGQVRPVGAGDTFNAGLIYGLRAGKSLEESLEYANAAGAHRVRSGAEPKIEDLGAITTEEPPIDGILELKYIA